MSQHESLRKRTKQHKPKNNKSKQDDKNIHQSAEQVIEYLKDRFNMDKDYENYELVYKKTIKISEMIEFIKLKGKRDEFYLYDDRQIKPDGGAIYLYDKKAKINYPLVIAEIKRQGTNNEREKEGDNRQSTGNAIERLGKNLTAIKAYMHYENITPFVCFGQGCDFAPKEKTVLTKIYCLNEFYEINRIYVNKKDNDREHGGFSPVSMYFREKDWSVEEMFNIMKEIAEYSFRYWMF